MKHAVSRLARFFRENVAAVSVVLVVLAAVTVLALRHAPVVPQSPARIDVQEYTFELRLSDTTDVIHGRAEVAVRFTREDVTDFALDLDTPDRPGAAAGMTVESVTSNGRDVTFTHENDGITITPADPPSRMSERIYTITYSGVPADGLIIGTNKYGDRTFFGDNWPNRAHFWLPTNDHPSDKATVNWSVVAPNDYQVVANGTLVEETDLPENLRLTRWSSTAPLATKIMVIGAARFAVEYVDEDDGISVQSWVYPQDRDAGFDDFARADTVLAFFADRLGPYPYEKLANVQSKTRYGGMENASAIFYNEDAVTGTGDAEALIAHEVAHQWYGNAVTEADWPHIWLSEGFATYLAALYLEHMYGAERLRETMQHARERVLAYHRRAPDALLVDSTTTNLLRLLNPNSYQKGAWMLHMLRREVGDDTFWQGLRTYYERFRHGNATTDDFQQVMEEAASRDLDAFFDQWFAQPGQPQIEAAWSYDEATSELTITLEQTQDRTFFDVPLDVGIQTTEGREPQIETVRVDERHETFTVPLDERPTAVTLDPHVWLLHEGDIQER